MATAEYMRKYREDPIKMEKHRKEVRERRRMLRENYRKEAIKLLGNKCIKCGFFDIRALQIDHVNSDAFKDRKLKHKGSYLYYKYVIKEIKKGSKRYQCLCANCNWIKRKENKEYVKRKD